MRVGDIVINRWAGHPEARYFIYTGTAGRNVNGLNIGKSGIRKCCYDKQSMNELTQEGEKAFEVVGHFDYLEAEKKALSEFVEKDREERGR